MLKRLLMKRSKMRSNKNNVFIAVALILVLTIPTFLVALPTVSAAETIPTHLLLSVEPDPAGVNQIVFLNAFLSKPTANAGMGGTGDMYEGITIQMTLPDGTKKTFGPLRADPTGGTWASYVPTKAGNYSVKAFYPGQTLKTAGQYLGTVYLPSESEVITLIVQTEPIPVYGGGPAEPTEYWARPIYATNYAWAKLGGNWWGLRAASFANSGVYDAEGGVNPFTTAPNSGHIMWTVPTAFGGQVGSPFSADMESQYTSTSILINHWEPIILNGVMFYNEYSTVDSSPKSWIARDIRTGEILWQRKAGELGNERLRMGSVVKFHSIQEYGSFPLLWSIVGGGMFGGAATYYIYDPKTGAYMGNVSGASDSAYLMDVNNVNQGTLLGYSTNGSSSAGYSLTMWNSTKMMAYPTNSTPSSSQLLLRVPSTVNYSRGYQWSTPLPNNVNGVLIGASMSIAARTHETILLRYAPNYVSQAAKGFAIEMAVDAYTGRILWGPINRTITQYGDIALLTAADGIYVMHDKDTNEAWGYSLRTGEQLWGPVQLTGNAWSHLERAAEIYDGKVIIWDFGGYVTALDQNNGNILWTWTPRSAGYDTPFGIYTIWHFGTDSVADGKIFLAEGHMYDPPLFPNAHRLAINTTDGKLVWDELGFFARAPGAVADGYLVEWNSYDNQIYSIGKGPTFTTVEVYADVVPLGNSILIKGYVMDVSTGTKDSTRAARFPNGVPAMSDADMSPWMEYVYMEQPKPTNATGVPVKLTAIGPDGSTTAIGTATSDMSGLYSAMWTPPGEGIYKIVASFEGSESYYISSGETVVGITKAAASPSVPTTLPPPTIAPPTIAPTPTPSPSIIVEPPQKGSDTALYVGITAVVIIAVIAAVALILRRRK